MLHVMPGVHPQGEVRARQCRVDESGREQQVDRHDAESGRGGATGARRGHSRAKRGTGRQPVRKMEGRKTNTAALLPAAKITHTDSKYFPSKMCMQCRKGL